MRFLSAPRPPSGGLIPPRAPCNRHTTVRFSFATGILRLRRGPRGSIYVGGRGLIRQTWSAVNDSYRVPTAVASELSLAALNHNLELPCPKPGGEAGWTFLSGELAGTTAAANAVFRPSDYDCGVDCPSHNACPEASYCCLTGGPSCVPMTAPVMGPCEQVSALQDSAVCDAVGDGTACMYRPGTSKVGPSCAPAKGAPPPPEVDKHGWLRVFYQDLASPEDGR